AAFKSVIKGEESPERQEEARSLRQQQSPGQPVPNFETQARRALAQLREHMQRITQQPPPDGDGAPSEEPGKPRAELASPRTTATRTGSSETFTRTRIKSGARSG